MNFSFWQIYFDLLSVRELDKNCIAYDNSEKKSIFFENDVIIDIHNNYKSQWEKSDYISIL